GGTSFNLLQQGMDAVWLKQRTTLQNIANVETPGYKAKYVDFETMYTLLRDASGNEGRMVPQIKATVKEDASTSLRVDGNNVDVEKENIELARAQIEYDYFQSKITHRFDCLEHVITEGKK
ncbi:MAG: flagellar basal body rod protein FlgB, partial [Acetanaerobacterium sp.]